MLNMLNNQFVIQKHVNHIQNHLFQHLIINQWCKNRSHQMKRSFLILSIFGLYRALNLLDRCKLYNIDPKHCQNSIYVPNTYYDNYLKSFNMPIQKDPECNTKNCLIVVYKEPPRIAVNSTGSSSNFCENGFNLQNFSVCMPSMQYSTNIPTITSGPEAPGRIVIQTLTVGPSSTNDTITLTGMTPKVITKTVIIAQTDDNKTTEESNTDSSTKSKEKTRTITKEVTTTIGRTSTDECEKSSDGESNKTSEYNSETKSECSSEKKTKENEIKTVTVTKDKNKTDEEKTKTVTVPPTVQPPDDKKTTDQSSTSDQSSQSSSTQTTPPPVPPTTSIPYINIEEIKKIIREKDKLCKFGRNDDNSCKECDGEGCSKRRKCKGENENECHSDETARSDSDEDQSSEEEGKKHSKNRKKRPKNKSKNDKTNKTTAGGSEKYITLLRYKTSTVTNEIPITLYRELLKTVEKEKPLTRYKVTTVNNTVTATVTKDRYKTTTVTSKKEITTTMTLQSSKNEQEEKTSSLTEPPKETLTKTGSCLRVQRIKHPQVRKKIKK
ncbi:hypothetical protein THOM_0435 [Trachipleistophora hominis]|uniref:Uncharacterized protein n=1 Tax=Trachipleistophora hominis TaxID=72359 RepID=L7JZ76_TRAHO|nr:hypothetical protein THOM_0435 [Trachipleistophora hominis]